MLSSANSIKHLYRLLLRKGVYMEVLPIWIHGLYRQILRKQSPPQAAFLSNLKDEGISDTDYTHAQAIWKKFDIRTLHQ